MNGSGSMRKALSLLAGLVLLAGCSAEVPGFLGREGNYEGFYSVRGEPTPEPVPLPLRTAVLEPALHGVIVRIETEAPMQGYYGPTLVPLNDARPDPAGIVTFQLVATPPDTPQAIGPARTRAMGAAAFMPTLALKNVRAIRVAGVGSAVTLTP
jgi:hypothetical protein